MNTSANGIFFLLLALSLSSGPLIATEAVTTNFGNNEKDSSSDSEEPESFDGGVSAYGENPVQVGHWFRLGAQMNFASEIDDFRPNLSGEEDIFAPQPLPTPTNRIRVSHSYFEVQLSALGDERRGPFADLLIGLGVQSLKSENASDLNQGSEIGKYEIAFKGSFLPATLIHVGFAKHQSAKLNLFDPYLEVFAGLRLRAYEGMTKNWAIGLNAGPDYRFRLPPASGSIVHYGPVVGGEAQIFLDWNYSSIQPFLRFEAGTSLYRTNMFEVAGIDEGGGGVLAANFGLKVQLLKGLWLGAQFTNPIFRPVGREYVLGSAHYPGLLGRSFNLSVQAATL